MGLVHLKPFPNQSYTLSFDKDNKSPAKKEKEKEKMKNAKIYISYASSQSISAAGCVVFNPTTNRIYKFTAPANSGETYLAALIRGACASLSTLDEPCDVEIVCDYIGLHSSIYKHSKYRGLNEVFKKLAESHNSVFIQHGRVKELRLLKEAKELAKAALKKTNPQPQAKEQSFASEEAGFIPDYIAFTDGSCNNLSPYGEGGAAYIILDGRRNLVKQNSKGFVGVTNNRMELMAILSAVAAVPTGSTLVVYTDSQYCIQVLTNKANANNFTRPNANIIRQYFNYASRLKAVRFEWVKGHNGDEFNEMADALAQSRTEEMRTIHNIPVYDYRNSPKCRK